MLNFVVVIQSLLFNRIMKVAMLNLIMQHRDHIKTHVILEKHPLNKIINTFFISEIFYSVTSDIIYTRTKSYTFETDLYFIQN